MSFLLLLDADKPDPLSDILPILARYEELVENAEPLFELKGRRLEEIAMTLPKSQKKYSIALKNMKSLEEWVGLIRDKRNAKAWKKFTEGYPQKLGPNDIKNYVGGDKEIIEINQIIIEVALIRQQLEAIVQAFEQMGWMITNMVKLRIAELQDAELN